MVLLNKRKNPIHTGEVYDVYKGICAQTGERALTPRRISGLISELEMLGIINVKVISKGRGGRTREISLTISKKTTEKVKKEIENMLGL